MEINLFFLCGAGVLGVALISAALESEVLEVEREKTFWL